MSVSHGLKRILAAVVFLACASGAGVAWAQSDWLAELKTGCDKGDAQDCSNLGGQLELHQTDLAGARAAYEKGCAVGSGLSGEVACARLYRVVSLGIGGPKDPDKARALEANACNTGIISLQVALESEGLCRK
jgi:hypothetical protein